LAGDLVLAAMTGVTFDFWNTLMWEEPGSLKIARLQVWAELFEESGLFIEQQRLEAAHDAAHAAYVDAWISGHQFRAEDAVEQMTRQLNANRRIKGLLIEGFYEGGRRAAIRPTDSVAPCLDALTSAGIGLAIICDIGLTPSVVVRQLLERFALDDFFVAMTFSDEVGHYKPAREIFASALVQLGGATPATVAHVGDRRRTDVAGARAIGMRSVRYTAVYDDNSAPTPEADVVLDDLAELPARLGVE
jgi:FMN phosphatase YigB (HAD superfamily)